MSRERVSWSFAFGLVVGPVILFFLLVPRALDLIFPEVSLGVKTLFLILGVITLLWSMLQSVKQANYILEWSILIAVLGVLFEVERLIPTSKPQVTFMQSSVDTTPTVYPSAVPKNSIAPLKKRVEKSRDTLQFTTFDAKELTPIPTPTSTPNLTPLIDLSAWTAKDQSPGRLPEDAFWGSKRSRTGGGDMGDWMQKLWAYLLGR